MPVPPPRLDVASAIHRLPPLTRQEYPSSDPESAVPTSHVQPTASDRRCYRMRPTSEDSQHDCYLFCPSVHFVHLFLLTRHPSEAHNRVHEDPRCGTQPPPSDRMSHAWNPRQADLGALAASGHQSYSPAVLGRDTARRVREAVLRRALQPILACSRRQAPPFWSSPRFGGVRATTTSVSNPFIPPPAIWPRIDERDTT